MKKGIHPDYKVVTVRCTTCGNTFEGGSILDEVRVDTCSNCHPFYTGKQKFGAAAGQVDKFNKRMAKKSEKTEKTEQTEQTEQAEKPE